MHLVGTSNDKSMISAIYLDILSSRNLVPVVFLFSNMPLPMRLNTNPVQHVTETKDGQLLVGT